MVGQNPGMSIFRENYSPPITSQPPQLRLISGSDGPHDPLQVSFGASEISTSAEGLNTAATNNSVKTFESSALAPNTMRFEKPATAVFSSSDEVKLQTLKQELDPLLKEKDKLSAALENWDKNAIPGMSKKDAEKALKKLDKKISPLWQAYTPLRQAVFDAKKTAASQTSMGDLLSRYQDVEVASRDEIRASASPKAQNALNAIDYYATPRSLESIEKDPNAPKLNMNEGMGLVHTRMMANFVDRDKTKSAEALFDALAQNPGMDLTAEQEQLLESYGMVPNGNGALINYGSNEVITAADFKDFGQIIEYQKAQLIATNETSDALKAISSTLLSKDGDMVGGVTSLLGSRRVLEQLGTGVAATDASVVQALMAESHYDSKVEGLEKSLAAAKAARADLEAAKADLLKGLQEVESGIETLQNDLGVLENTIDGIQNLSTEEDMVSYLENASPAQKSLLNSAGISLQTDASGQNKVMVNGEPWQPGSDAVGAALQQAYARMTSELESLRQQADTVQTQISDIDEQIVKADGVADDLENSLKSHRESFSAYQEEVDRMLALRNDPERWNALSPADQQIVEAFLARSGPKITRGQELQNEGSHELTQLRATIADTKQVVAQAKIRMADIFDSLLQLQQQHQGVGAKVYAMVGRATEGEQKAATLIQKADALARKVELAPRPNAEDVGALIEEWQAILKESAAHFNELAESMSTNQRIESERLAHYAAEAKELQEYTQQYLKDVTTLGKGQIEQVHDRIRDLTDQLAG